jgi:glutaredoxin/glutathione-dependent peroxiredoxin
MTIKVGDKLPDAGFLVKGADGPERLTTDNVFAGKKVVLIGVPGAFTPTCSGNHLPGFLDKLEAIKSKGVDTIACTAVNDVHVMDAWSKASGSEGKVQMLADGNGEFARAIGLEADFSAAHMGHRSGRYSMLVEDGVVKQLNVETERGVNVSGADTILTQL